ncbi:hypothetical protein [Aureibacter tunicatorum]|uniref:Outer membrane protein assembly factor BamE (Lipoprotein component of BamABCDE complex) n=1 Tax=Aureibacter tunicatorum TaxID=866807 RepID=A0AAE3XNG3_9BACT|nr:hypothetical protein [Aureibacter tunicatorum]MDR6239114.1 outer membrane protein assembly factor BamE (lipoprotein component of BamABCDE complex) [Aureibacter tunicatorum]
MKKVTLAIILAVIWLPLLLLLIFVFRTEDSDDYGYLEKLDQLHVGLKTSDVVKILGQPEEKSYQFPDTVYVYPVPKRKSGEIEVFIDTAGQVSNIIYGNNEFK